MTEFENLTFPSAMNLKDWNDDKKNTKQSCFLTAYQLSVYLTASDERGNFNLLIVDCGTPFRFHERHIKNALFVSITDRLSRRRLATRGFERFLDASQLERFQESDLIVLYDDLIHLKSTACSHELIGSYQLSASMQTLLDQIQRYDPKKKFRFFNRHSTILHKDILNIVTSPIINEMKRSMINHHHQKSILVFILAMKMMRRIVKFSKKMESVWC